MPFKSKGLKSWLKALEPQGLTKALRKNIRVATTLNGKVGEAVMRKVIQSGRLRPNAPLTKLIKKSAKPLVDSGLFFQSITSKVKDDFTVFVGVLRTSERYNLIVVLHEGEVIKVTPAMRGMFFMLWRASTGEIEPSALTGRAAELWARKPGGWFPLRDSTTVIVIKARPFSRMAFDNPQFRKTVRDNWNKALAATFKDIAKDAKRSDDDDE